jgi:transposase
VKNRNMNRSNDWRSESNLTIGIDLGDKTSSYCVRGADGEIRHEDRVRTNSVEFARLLGGIASSRIVLEVGTHSPWVSRLLEGQGHEVIVANPRRLKLISESDRKTDRIDARLLSELGYSMPRLLNAVRHRSAEAQADLAVLRVRARLVEARTKLWNSLRGTAKALGRRLPRKVTEEHLEQDGAVLRPLWEMIVSLTETIQKYDQQIADLARRKYPVAIRLQQVAGVGPIISLTFVLTIEHAERFRRSRDVGSYVGLGPKQRQSDGSSPQLGITKAGDRYLRQMLVQGAQYILGRQAPDSELRRWGLKLASRGGKIGKKRAVVAVARKLAVLMHRLWVSNHEYDPFYRSRAEVAVGV